jgi:CBS-domain-containing membrane protein
MTRWTVADVMRREVIAVAPDTSLRRVADMLVTHAISAVPVVDTVGRVLGVVSEADLLGKLEYADRAPHHALAARRVRSGSRRVLGDTAAALMTAPAITICAEASVSGAARLMDAARVKRLPVVDTDGRLVGVVSRRDLVRLFTREDVDVATTVADHLHDLGVDESAVVASVSRGVVTLHGTVARPATATAIVSVVAAIPGVVDVVSDIAVAPADGGAHAPTTVARA